MSCLRFNSQYYSIKSLGKCVMGNWSLSRAMHNRIKQPTLEPKLICFEQLPPDWLKS